jgi:molybdenum cofactor biosynthesis enzyme MoaA
VSADARKKVKDEDNKECLYCSQRAQNRALPEIIFTSLDEHMHLIGTAAITDYRLLAVSFS